MSLYPRTAMVIAVLLFSLPATAEILTHVEVVDLPPAFRTRAFLSPNIPIEPQAGASTTTIEGVSGFDSSLGTLVDVLMEVSWEFEVTVSVETLGIVDPTQAHFSIVSFEQGSTGWTTRDNGGFAQGNGRFYNAFGNCVGQAGDSVPCTGAQTLSDSNSLAQRSLFGLVDVIDVDEIDAFDLTLWVPLPEFNLINVSQAVATADLRVTQGALQMTYVYDDAILTLDSDEDGIRDIDDNCAFTANPDQVDVDGDGYGNLCDADVSNDCIVNVVDLGLMRNGFFSADPSLDFNSDGVVNAVDLGIMRLGYFDPPGPSGPAGLCE